MNKIKNIDHLSKVGMHDGALPIIFERARLLRSKMTEPERKLWFYLKTKPFRFKFRRQHPIFKYILDFYCHTLRLSFEIDGISHRNPEIKAVDKERTEYLNSVGITEFRFSNEKVMDDFSDLQNDIQMIVKNKAIEFGSQIPRPYSVHRSLSEDEKGDFGRIFITTINSLEIKLRAGHPSRGRG